MHRGKEAYSTHAFVDCMADAVHRITLSRIHHKEPIETVREMADCLSYRVLVAGDAGDKNRALHSMMIEFLDPTSRQRRRIPIRCFEAQMRELVGDRSTFLPAEYVEKVVRKKVHVGI